MKFERLGENIKQIRGISYKPNDISIIPLPDYVPVLKANNIQERGIDTKDLIYIHKNKVKPEQFIKKGDLLLAASSGSKEIVGKNIFFENNFEGSFGAFCKLVRPKEGIHSKFVGVFFKTPYFKRHIRNLINGALINNLKNEHIDSLLIPTLSLPDQLHIANLLSKAETLISQRKESIRLLDEYLKSTFLEMFGDPTHNPMNWESKRLDEVSRRITDGKHGDCADEANSGYYFLSAKDLNDGKLKYTDVREITKSDFLEVHKRTDLKLNDILLGNTGASIGKIGIVVDEEKASRTTFQKSISIITLNTILVVPLYIKMYLGLNRKIFNKTSTGSAMSNLLLSQIRAFNILIPPIELQTQFAQIVEKTEALKSQYQQSLQELENLYGSLSQKAFKGELTQNKNHG